MISVLCSVDIRFKLFDGCRFYYWCVAGLATLHAIHFACTAHFPRIEFFCVIFTAVPWIEGIQIARISVPIKNFLVEIIEIRIFTGIVSVSVAILVGGFNSFSWIQRFQVIHDPTALPATDICVHMDVSVIIISFRVFVFFRLSTIGFDSNKFSRSSIFNCC